MHQSLLSLSRYDTLSRIAKIRLARGLVCMPAMKPSNFGSSVRRTPPPSGTTIRPSVEKLMFNSLTLTTKVFDHYELAKTACGVDYEVVGNYGSGPLKYEGSWSEDGGVFSGENIAMQSYIIVFSGQEGLTYLRMLVGSLEKTILEKFTSSRVRYSCGFDAIETMQTEEQFSTAAQKVITSQADNKPALAFKKRTLMIGTATATANVQISPLLSSAVGQISGFQAVVSLKGTVATNLWVTLISKESFDLTNLLAFFFLEALNKVSSSELIELVRRNLRANYDLGGVVLLRKENLKLSPSLRYVQSALKAIESRLNDSSLSLAAQALIITFLNKILFEPSNIVQLAAFQNKLIEAVAKRARTTGSAPAAAPAPKRAASPTRGQQKAVKTATAAVKDAQFALNQATTHNDADSDAVKTAETALEAAIQAAKALSIDTETLLLEEVNQ